MRRHSTRKKDTFLNLLLYLSALYEGQRPRPGRAGSYPAPILDRIKSCDLYRLFRVMSNGATLNWCEPHERRLPLKARAGTALKHGQQAHCLSTDSYTKRVGDRKSTRLNNSH